MVVQSINECPAATKIQPLYLETQTLVERLHRRLLDVIEDEFDRRGRSDINAVQALIDLLNINDSELSVSELRGRGFYLGSNVSYNLKKLVDLGLLDHQRALADRHGRVRIKLTAQRGREVRDIVEELYRKHAGTVEQASGIRADEIAALNKSLQRLERFWVDQVMYRLLIESPKSLNAFIDPEYSPELERGAKSRTRGLARCRCPPGAAPKKRALTRSLCDLTQVREAVALPFKVLVFSGC